jgi:hypothetical protein
MPSQDALARVTKDRDGLAELWKDAQLSLLAAETDVRILERHLREIEAFCNERRHIIYCAQIADRIRELMGSPAHA